MIQVAIEFDGLLIRFGRVVPDALAMLEGISNIQRRLKGGSRPAELESIVVRFAVGASRAGTELGTSLVEFATRVGFDSYFQPLNERSRVVSGVSDLSRALRGEAQQDMRIVLLSASRRRISEAAGFGIEAFHIWESGQVGERWLPYKEVPRMLEEMLRIPTARPMAPSVRQGALVSVAIAGEAEARSRGLDAIRRDPNADWVALGGVFILYTENPDLEDDLVEKMGFQRLTFSVNKGDLVIDTNGSVIAVDALFSSPGISLRKRVAEDATRGGEALIPWEKARQRFLSPRTRDRSRRASSPSASDVRARLEPVARALQQELSAESDVTATSVYRALQTQLLAESAVDLLWDEKKPPLLTWQAPYGSEEVDDLLVVVHDVSCQETGSTSASRDCLFEVALAVAPERTFALTNPPRGALHCVRLDPTVSVNRLLEKALLATERARVAVILELSRLSVLRQSSARWQVTFSKELESDVDDFRRRFPSTTFSIVSQEAGSPAVVRITGATGEPTDPQGVELLVSTIAGLLG